jgi:hypothetical protein
LAGSSEGIQADGKILYEQVLTARKNEINVFQELSNQHVEAFERRA